MTRTLRDCDGERVSCVGRIGELDLGYVRRERETILAEFRCCSPWHLLPPMTLDDSGCAYTLLLNPSGGLVGGDCLSLRARVGPEAHVLFSTPSATRVYRSVSEPSIHCVDLTVGPGAILEWVPDVTIPFAGSRFHQTIHVRLGTGATVLLWDAVASGRMARSERWAFTSLDNEIRITTAGGRSVLDRYCLTQVDGQDGIGAALGLVSEWDYVASLYLVNDALEEEVWKRLEQTLGDLLEGHERRVLGGVSQPAVPGLVVKLVARSAPDLSAAFETIWAAVREALWSLPVPALRRY